MQIHKNIDKLNINKPVITVGIFDGVHRGHSKLLSVLAEKAKSLSGESVILTFWPHPQYVIRSFKDEIRLLNTIDEKITLIGQSGIGHLIIFPFTKKLSLMSSELFVKEILVDKLNVHTLIVGYDNHIGKDKEGGFEQMKKYSGLYRFDLFKVDEECVNDLNVSSTKIRNFLMSGEIEKANLFLGYKYSITGKVIRGENIGSKIGFPTANIEIEDKHKLVPPAGVYVVEVLINEKRYKGLLNKGTRPTFENVTDNESTEVFIIDFNENIYGKIITVKYLTKIREEMKFENVELLVRQINTDKQIALKFFNTLI